MRPKPLRTFAVFLATLTVILAACDDDEPTGPEDTPAAETAVVINSIDLSLSVFPVDSPQNRRAIGIAQAGSPVSLAARNNTVVVPLGQLSAAAVIDLATDDVTSIPLPDNSGATGVAFWSDSIAYVANSERNTVSRINVVTGVAGPEVDVGVYPQALIASRFWVFVLNGELDANFQPARTGSITVIDPKADTVRSTIFLSGFNPAAAAYGSDGLIYVVNSGTFGQGDGSLSVIEPVVLTEVEHVPGFGEFPGDIAIDDSGFAYVSSFFYGIAVWNISEGAFLRSPFDPLLLDGHAISSGVGFDSDGRLYSLLPGDCQAPSVALRSVDDSVEKIGVGVCPAGIVFTEVGGR